MFNVAQLFKLFQYIRRINTTSARSVPFYYVESWQNSKLHKRLRSKKKRKPNSARIVESLISKQPNTQAPTTTH